jgi:hypothetical protein
LVGSAALASISGDLGASQALGWREGTVGTRIRVEWQRTLKARGQALLANPGDGDLYRAFYDTWFPPFFGHTAARARSRGDFCPGTPESRRNKTVGVDRYTVSSLGDFDWRGASDLRVPWGFDARSWLSRFEPTPVWPPPGL